MADGHGSAVQGGHGSKTRGGLAALLRSWWQDLRAARRRRETLKALLSIDDTILADIGIERRDILRAARAPDHSKEG